MVKHGAVSFVAQPDTYCSEGLWSYLLSMRPPLLSSDFDICYTEQWDEVSKVWFVFVDQFKGGAWLVFVEMEGGDDVVAYFNGTFDSEPPEGGWNKRGCDPVSGHFNYLFPPAFDKPILGLLMGWGRAMHRL